MQPKNVLALCGSTRARSSNKRYLEAVERLAGPAWSIVSYEGLLLLPPFNPDVDPDHPPAPVQDLLDVLAAADGVVICTPEYAMGVPGTLKNLIDWTVATSAFSKKPTALITASLGGQKGHAALMETLKVIEASMTEKTQMVISHAQTKINADSVITDPAVLERVRTLVWALDGLMQATPAT
jgi:NAD(P)H-dependent FMN reductase